MTDDIRTAAQREAEELYPDFPPDIDLPAHNRSKSLRRKAYVKGYLAGAARVTPTREQMVAVLYEAICEFPTRQMDHSRSWAMQEAEEYADAVLAGLAEGES